jgi:hypothetical protein
MPPLFVYAANSQHISREKPGQGFVCAHTATAYDKKFIKIPPQITCRQNGEFFLQCVIKGQCHEIYFQKENLEARQAKEFRNVFAFLSVYANYLLICLVWTFVKVIIVYFRLYIQEFQST